MTINAAAKSVTLVPLGSGDLSSANPTGGKGAWQLPDGHWIAAKFPMVAVFPRPDSETALTAFVRNAYPTLEYSVPCEVAGGAWPFFFELVDGPSGATIPSPEPVFNSGTGVYDIPADYGVVKWTPATAGGPFTFHVKVHGQDGNTIDLIWTVTASTDAFVFVSGSAAGGGDGTISSPLTWVECFGTDSSYAVYGGKCAYFRGGTDIIASGYSDQNGNLNANWSRIPKAWIAYPGESPVIDLNLATKFMPNTGGSNTMSDAAFVGLRFKNARQDVNNAHYFWNTGKQDRMLYWKNYFDPLAFGLVGSDNPAAIFYSGSAPGTPSEYLAIVGNTFDGMGGGSTNGVSSVDSYNISKAVFEHNILKNCTSQYLHWRKGGHEYTTVRNETGVEGNTISGGSGGVFVTTLGTDGNSLVSHDNELCWCRGISLSAAAVDRLLWATSAGGGSNLFIYRNTLKGSREILLGQIAGLTSVENDVLTDSSFVTDIGVKGQNLAVVPTGDIDVDGNLTGSSRATYLGTHGAEIV